ncbi:MAG: S-adenosylmethionine:tRNA ribosyltransferase-isomerase, partial [Acidobacteriota bacterium]
DGDLETVIDAVGRTPLPPYIKRDENAIDDDRQRYQTVFASRRGAIAAPTAGLHFTRETIEKVRDRKASVVELTLHVGYGTFEPVRVEDLGEHRVMAERYEIDEAVADILNTARNEGRRIIAIGTTTTRALESSVKRNGRFMAEEAQAELTVTPGYRFAAINAMLTNFHLPRSSLLVLVSTFAGHELIMKAYRHAVSADYRFYSYGDCMFIA